MSDNKTALHIALDRKTNEIVQTLLESGAAVDVKDSEGETSLHKAVRAGELFTQIIVSHAKGSKTNHVLSKFSKLHKEMGWAKMTFPIFLTIFAI